MIIDCVADLHGHYPQLEGGDLLIVAGNLTARDTCVEHIKFQMWLHDQKYSKKIIVAGNHDNRLQELGFASVQRQYAELEEDYLCDSGTEFEGLKIWGSPWTLRFEGMNPNCMAFTCETEEELAEKWAMIPQDTDILVTHAPAYGILDQVEDMRSNKIESKGSKSLYGYLKYAFRPKLHVFGHIHEGYGLIESFPGYNNNMVKSINASHVNERYEPVNKPIRIVL